MNQTTTTPKIFKFHGHNTENLYHTRKNNPDGTVTFTGFSLEEIEVGDVCELSPWDGLTVISIERRDHKGVFSNRLMNVNSFITVVGARTVFRVVFESGVVYEIPATTEEFAKKKAVERWENENKSNAAANIKKRPVEKIIQITKL